MPANPGNPKGPESANPDQSREFIKIAKELGCDEDEAAFRDKLRVIARQKPEPKKRAKG